MDIGQVKFISAIALFALIASSLAFSMGFFANPLYLWAEEGDGSINPLEPIDFNETGYAVNETEFEDYSNYSAWDWVVKGFWDTADWIMGGLSYTKDVIWDTLVGVPIIGQLLQIASWIWNGIVFFLALLTMQWLPQDMPFVIKIAIMTPIYAAMFMILMPVFSKIMEGLGNAIPTT